MDYMCKLLNGKAIEQWTSENGKRKTHNERNQINLDTIEKSDCWDGFECVSCIYLRRW
jgi:hypothetical protein